VPIGGGWGRQEANDEPPGPVRTPFAFCRGSVGSIANGSSLLPPGVSLGWPGVERASSSRSEGRWRGKAGNQDPSPPEAAPTTLPFLCGPPGVGGTSSSRRQGGGGKAGNERRAPSGVSQTTLVSWGSDRRTIASGSSLLPHPRRNRRQRRLALHRSPLWEPRLAAKVNDRQRELPPTRRWRCVIPRLGGTSSCR